MQKIIALAANKDQGKSTTLNILIDLLSSIADECEIYRDSLVDSWAWFKINEKWVYIGTEGDEAKSVKGNIKNTKKYDCFIGITASRITGETAKVVKQQTDDENTLIKMIRKEALESELSKLKDNCNAKNRIIAGKLFQEIFNATVPELAGKELME